MYIITGATGNTGSVVAHKLLDAGQKVRVVGRSKEKLQPFAARGAEEFVADVTDANAMTDAFAGAKAVYSMLPPEYPGDLRAGQDKAAAALATAIEKAGVKHVVNLSSVGADKTEGTGPIVGLHRFEKRLNAIAGLNVLHLRPGYFFENTLMMIPVIKQMGMLAGAYDPSVAIPMIATRDIGARAADELLRLGFTGSSTRELQGPRNYSYNEVAKLLGAAIGKPGLGYMQVPFMMVDQALVGMGVPASTAKLLNEMTRSLNNGQIVMLEPRSAENTTPTTLDQWAADVFAPAFHGKAAKA